MRVHVTSTDLDGNGSFLVPDGAEEVLLEGLANLTSLKNETLPRSLKKLRIGYCPKFASLPPLSEGIEEVVLRALDGLVSLENAALPASLKKLMIGVCPKLVSLPPLAEGVEEVGLYNLGELVLLENAALPASLKKLRIGLCPKLASLPPLAEGVEEVVLSTLDGLVSLENTALPASLKRLTISYCPELASLPLLPDGLRVLDITNASGLIFTPELLEQLQTLEANGCEIHYPQHYFAQDPAYVHLQRRLEAAVETYRSTHPEYTGQKLVDLTYRYLTEFVEQRGTFPDLVQAFEPIVAFAEQHPEHLGWMENIASSYSRYSVTGHSELCAWIAVANEPTMTGKTEAAKQLLALEAIKRCTVGFFKQHGVAMEAVSVFLREVHPRLLQEGVIAKAWTGVPDRVHFEDVVRGFITEDGIQQVVALVKTALQSVDKLTSFLCTAHSPWQYIALDPDALQAKREEIDRSFAEQEEAHPAAEVLQRKEAMYKKARIDMTQELLAKEQAPGTVLEGAVGEYIQRPVFSELPRD